MPSARKTSQADDLTEERYQWIGVYYLTNKKDREEIEKLILGKGSLSNAPYSLIDYILSGLTNGSLSNCQSIVVEYRYRDKDHSKALSVFYSKSFKPVNAECIRLHLFSRRIRPEDVVNRSVKKLQDSYLGFCVLRPFPHRRIGRTFLKRVGYVPNLEFPTCHGNFEVNLVGITLNLKGSCFMEQDTLVAACATVSLWSATTMMGNRFSLPSYSTTEITQLASQYLVRNRPMPSEGLFPDQMINGLRSMGYDPLLIEIEDQKQAKHIIYSYIESEIPPILLCDLATGGHHTIVGVGHGYNFPVSNPEYSIVDWPGEPPLRFARSSEWVPFISVNDDQRGIYRKMEFLDTASGMDVLRNRVAVCHPHIDSNDPVFTDWSCPVEIDNGMPDSGKAFSNDIANIWGIVVPLPPGVLLSSVQAERKSARLIRFWHWLNHIDLPTDLVLRTYVIPSNEYKKRIADSGMHPFVKDMVRGKPMPKWIWVTEISSIASYNSPDPANWLIRGQVIIDATSNAFDPDFLVFHYIVNDRSILATMTPDHEDAEESLSHVWESNSVTAYHGWVR